jgi:hypothetical protein
MKTIKRYALLTAIVAISAWPLIVSADDKNDAAPLPTADYLELKKFKQLPSAQRIAQSNLRQKEIIQKALANSATARELIASQLAAGQDVLAARGAKAPTPTRPDGLISGESRCKNIPIPPAVTPCAPQATP